MEEVGLKLAFYAPWEIKDGIYTYTRFLRDGLKKSEIDSDVIPHYEEKMSLTYVKEIAEKGSDYDVVHIQHEFGYFGNWKNPFNPLFSTFLKNIKTKKVVTVHGFHPWMIEIDPTRPHPPFRAAKKFIRNVVRLTPWARYTFGQVFNQADRIIVHTDFHRSHLIDLGVDSEKIRIVPHGVSSNQKLGDGEGWKKKKGLTGKKILTIFGFMDQSKGYDLALKALEELPSECVLLIAGGTRIPEQVAFRELLWREIKERKMADRVVETGFVGEREVAEIMGATDLLLVPQHYASTSGSLHLGLSYGKTIIASDLPYAVELSNRLECLKLIPRGNKPALKAAIMELMENKERRKNLEESAKKYANVYCWEEIAKRHKRLYEELLETI